MTIGTPHSESAQWNRRWLAAMLAATIAVGFIGASCGNDDDDDDDGSGDNREDEGDDALELPEPSGSAAVGTVSLHLVDQSRNDPFAATPQSRELMVNLWYPAESSEEHPLAPYLEANAAADWERGFELPSGALSELHTHAREAAPVAPSDSGAYPVVIYSPGSGSGRAFGTVLVEELVSQEYVVVTLDHTYDAAVVEFPDGTLIPAKEQETPEGGLDLATLDSLAEPQRAARVADVRFVLDKLTELQAGTNPDADNKPLPDNLAGTLDLSRIGMLGHSLGGSTAAQTLLEDPRVLASFAMDSAMPPPVRAAGLDRPIMLMRSDQPELAPITEAAWQELQTRGWHRNLHLTDSGHNSFTDLAVFCAQLDECPDAINAMVGTIDGEQAIETERAYTTAFFDQILKDTNQPLLDEPSTDHPQVKFLP